jgi:hypothetical protein
MKGASVPILLVVLFFAGCASSQQLWREAWPK